MKAPTQAITAIKKFEGCKLTAYQDSVGVWTVGFGTTGPAIVKGLVIDQAQADRWLQDRCDELADDICNLSQTILNDNQLSALISFAYNLGLGALKGSTLLKMINNGNMDGATGEFLKWDHAGGKVLAGLTARRQAEKALFEEAV
jgi:lysozyme